MAVVIEMSDNTGKRRRASRTEQSGAHGVLVMTGSALTAERSLAQVRVEEHLVVAAPDHADAGVRCRARG